jgi:hypothetical protein
VNPDDAWKLFHVRKGESAAARQAAVGAAVGFSAAMDALADAAAEAGKKNQMLDFAYFDCSACHHDLVVPSWRQAGRGVPGRPMPRTGPTTLVRAAAGDTGGFDDKFNALLRACADRPFGTPTAIAPAAKDLAAWADGVAKGLNDAHYDDTRTAQLRREIADAARKPSATGRGLDYDDAQQLYWAFDGLKDEGTPVPAKLNEALAALAGPNKPLLGRLYDEKPGERTLIFKLLPDRLRRVSKYRPESFREAFEKIADALKP